MLTAAHCLYDTSKEELGVTVSMHRYNYSKTSAQEGGEDRKIKAFYHHPRYDPTAITNDIALLHLEHPVNASVIKPVTLDWDAAAKAGSSVMLIGWGSLDVACKDYKGVVLYKGDMVIPPDATCTKMAGAGFNNSKQLCAGKEEGKGKWVEAGCGDSGGPLLFKSGSGGWVQTGLTSWGYGNDYDVYTRVAGYKDWIEGCMKDEATCGGGKTTDDDEKFDQGNEDRNQSV